METYINRLNEPQANEIAKETWQIEQEAQEQSAREKRRAEGVEMTHEELQQVAVRMGLRVPQG